MNMIPKKMKKEKRWIKMSQLNSLLMALRSAGIYGISSLEIIKRCGIVNTTGRISDLRNRGYNIPAPRKEKRMGKIIYRYVLMP